MKTKSFTKTIVTAAVLILSVLSKTSAASYIIGLSPHYDTADREKVLQQVLLFMLQGASSGDDITVCDALNQHVVARFAIPDSSLFQNNAQARARRLATSIVAVKGFVLSEQPHSPEMTAAIALPEFLNLIAQLHAPGQTLRVILIGSPLYVSNDGAFDERDAYPSDANLTAEERSSPWSTISRKNTLIGVTVHFAYLHNCFVNDFHQERVCRFLTLFIKEQSGSLATFAPDASMAFQRACQNIQQPVMQAEIDPNDTKLEMRHVQARSIPVWFGSVSAAQNATVTNLVPQIPSEEAVHVIVTNAGPQVLNRVTNAVPDFPITVKSNIIGIGLMWGAPVDVDLHVFPGKSARELYYGYTQSKEGTYFHDYRDANQGIDYEYVELKNSVDIRNVEVWANYYAGTSWPVHGRVVVFYQGKTYYGEFSLAAHNGNRCGESDSRSLSPAWTKIDLLKIVGLSP